MCVLWTHKRVFRLNLLGAPHAYMLRVLSLVTCDVRAPSAYCINVSGYYYIRCPEGDQSSVGTARRVLASLL